MTYQYQVSYNGVFLTGQKRNTVYEAILDVLQVADSCKEAEIRSICSQCVPRDVINKFVHRKADELCIDLLDYTTHYCGIQVDMRDMVRKATAAALSYHIWKNRNEKGCQSLSLQDPLNGNFLQVHETQIPVTLSELDEDQTKDLEQGMEEAIGKVLVAGGQNFKVTMKQREDGSIYFDVDDKVLT